MTEYLIPTGDSTAEFSEKRSRFIGQVFSVEQETEARANIEAVKKKHYNATHNCWCYLIRAGGVLRYSDDGEPQGTAGLPMLEVFQREKIFNVCCVVTRYFGGILLGAGGLLRAYTRAAKDALDAAGVSAVRRWVDVAVPCPYAFYERVKREVEHTGGILGETEYGAEILVHALLPEENVDTFSAHITALTAGGIAPVIMGEALRAVPL